MSGHDGLDVLEVNGRPVGRASVADVPQFPESALCVQDAPIFSLPVIDLDVRVFELALDESTAAHKSMRFRIGDRLFMGILGKKPPYSAGAVTILSIVLTRGKPAG